MVKFILQHIVDIACIVIAVILTVIFGYFDTEMAEAYGNGITYLFYGVFSANLMFMPWFTISFL